MCMLQIGREETSNVVLVSLPEQRQYKMQYTAIPVIQSYNAITLQIATNNVSRSAAINYHVAAHTAPGMASLTRTGPGLVARSLIYRLYEFTEARMSTITGDGLSQECCRLTGDQCPSTPLHPTPRPATLASPHARA